MRKYLLKHNELHLPYIAKKFNVSLEEVVAQICDLWNIFENPHVVDNLLYTNYPTQNWWFEVCDTPYKRGKTRHIDEIEAYCKHNIKENQHISVYAHDKKWKINADKGGSVSVNDTKLYLPWLWLELDRKNYEGRANKDKALTDAHTIKRDLKIITEYEPDVFDSGNCSTHIKIDGRLFGNPIISCKNTKVIRRLAHLIAKDVRHQNKINDVYTLSKTEALNKFKEFYPEPDTINWQRIYQSLENIDPNIYHRNSLIRQPFSFHEKGKGQKTVLNPEKSTHFSIKPRLLTLWYKAWEQEPKKSQKKVGIPLDSSYILSVYEKFYPDIKYMNPDNRGFVGAFHNILYEDTKPSVYININTGYIHDFGSEIYCMDFDEFITEVRQ